MKGNLVTSEEIEALRQRLREICARRTMLLAPIDGQHTGVWSGEELSFSGLRELTALDGEEKAILTSLSQLRAERIGKSPVNAPWPARRPKDQPEPNGEAIRNLLSWTLAAITAHVRDIRNAKPEQHAERKRQAILFSNFVRNAVAPAAEGFSYDGNAAPKMFCEAAKLLRDTADGNNETALLVDDLHRIERKIELLASAAGVDMAALRSIGQGPREASEAILSGEANRFIAATAGNFVSRSSRKPLTTPLNDEGHREAA